MPKSPVEFPHPFEPVGGSRKSNAPVRMQVVHIGKGKEAVEGRVNRGRHRIAAKGTQRVESNHFVLVLDATVAALERAQLFQIRSEERRVGKEWRCGWARD